jgi:hypothetical protein
MVGQKDENKLREKQQEWEERNTTECRVVIALHIKLKATVTSRLPAGTA